MGIMEGDEKSGLNSQGASDVTRCCNGLTSITSFGFVWCIVVNASSARKGGISDQSYMVVVSTVSRLLTIVNMGPSLRNREESVIICNFWECDVIYELRSRICDAWMCRHDIKNTRKASESALSFHISRKERARP